MFYGPPAYLAPTNARMTLILMHRQQKPMPATNRSMIAMIDA